MTATRATEHFTQWICESEPACKCLSAPDDGGECVCERIGGTGEYCDLCLAPMIEIDVDTGNRVTPEQGQPFPGGEGAKAP